MLGFLPAALLLMAMARRIVRRLRGFDPQPRGGVATLLRLLVPLLLLVAAASAFFARDPRTGVFALLGAIAAGVLLPGARGPLGVAPQALSSGPLRDRLFDLARRAGVRLRELYVAPMRRQRMANAFAVNGGVVMVTDELLDRMSRREVDAVLAHEISHLEHHHPRMMVASAGLAWALMSVISMPVGFAYVVPMGIAASWLAYLFVARRCEFAADAGAAALTADPEAMISGLGQLARLNDTPLCWSRARGWLITHPTTEARAKAIGRRAGIAEDRVAELLEKGLVEHDRYAQSERPGEGERVFSTAWKTRTLGRLSLTLLASAVIAPALAIALLRAFGVATPHALAILGGALLAFLAVLAAQDQIAARPVSRLEPALRQRIAESSGTEARFVAMSPGDRPRVYEGFLDWDLGVLTLTPERLHYRGEQITLDLPRDAVSQIEVGAVAPGWIPAPRVIVRWQGPEGETAWTLRAADARRVSAIGPATLGLAARLRSWRGPAPPTPMTGPPAIGPVTAITLAQATAPRDLPVLLVLLGTFSAAASYLLGLDFWLGVDVLAAALIGLMVMRWPAMTSREPARVKTGAHQPERRAA
jgi:Zn-dependent protease with chaperone function